jgi:hypothetical protein
MNKLVLLNICKIYKLKIIKKCKINIFFLKFTINKILNLIFILKFIILMIFFFYLI